MCGLHLSRFGQRERGSSLQRRTAGQVIARRRVARDCAAICLASPKTSAGDPSRIFACAKNFKTALATNLTRFTKLTKSAMLGDRFDHTPVDADPVQEDSDDHLENTQQSSRALPNSSSKWRGGSFRVKHGRRDHVDGLFGNSWHFERSPSPRIAIQLDDFVGW